MTELLRKMLSAPGKMMQEAIRHDVTDSGSGKIITDINGSATVNMKNQQVRASMRARMEELAVNGKR